MSTTTHRTGDYVGPPANRAKGLLYWTDTTHTQMQAFWIPTPPVDPRHTDHLLLYVDGMQDADRTNRTSQIFAVPTPGVVPNVAAIYTPEQCDYDNAYDPIGSDPSAVNCVLAVTEVLVLLMLLLSRGNKSKLRRLNELLLAEQLVLIEQQDTSSSVLVFGASNHVRRTEAVHQDCGSELSLDSSGGICVQQN